MNKAFSRLLASSDKSSKGIPGVGILLKAEIPQVPAYASVYEGFEFIARFFETSMQELVKRNPGIDQRFQRVDATHFTAALYQHGQKVCKGSVADLQLVVHITCLSCRVRYDIELKLRPLQHPELHTPCKSVDLPNLGENTRMPFEIGIPTINTPEPERASLTDGMYPRLLSGRT
jgi:hypothetical protein